MNTGKAADLCIKISALLEGHTGDEAIIALTMSIGGILGAMILRETERYAQIDRMAATLKAALKTDNEPRLQ